MDPLAVRVRRTIRRLDLMPRRSRVVAAVSGGADSMALVHLLRDLEPTGECRLVGIAHLNHGLRGEAADQDEAFCRSAAAALGVAFESERVDVRLLARGQRASIESAGHDARYAFLARAAARLQADRVALGHTRDDQAETFLLRLLRGSGPRGLGGMHPRAGVFIRPMLECSRSEVREFVRTRGIAYREDATNADVSIPRNWMRHKLLPVLSTFSPAVVRVLAREAAIARDDAALLDALSASAFDRLVEERGETSRVDCAGLAAEAPATARRVLAIALGRRAPGRFVGFDHLQRVLALARQDAVGRALLLPGVRVERGANSLTIEAAPVRGGGRRPTTRPLGTNSFRFSLSIPSEVFSDLGWALESQRTSFCGDVSRLMREAALDGRSAVLDAASLVFPLSIRNWSRGDRFRPLGLGGGKKLQDYFVDRKVPRADRSRVPIVVTADERVVWVAGYAIAEDFRVTAGTSDVVILKLKYWRNGT